MCIICRFALAFLFLFELLLVGVNTVLQTAQFLCKRVRQVDLVERIRRRRTDTLTGNLDDARLDADNRGIRRNRPRSTTAFAPIRLLSPTLNGPRTFAPVEMSTLLPMVG